MWTLIRAMMLILLFNLFPVTAFAGFWDPQPPVTPPTDPQPPVTPPPVPVNNAPTISAPATVSGNEGTTVTFNVSGFDAENDVVVLSASGLPEGSTFDPTTGAFTWDTTCGDLGLFDMTFTATTPVDGKSATASTSVNILTVSESEYYSKMIPKVQAELSKLATKKHPLKHLSNRLTEAAKLFGKGKVRQAMEQIDHACNRIARKASRKVIPSAEPMSSMLCCDTNTDKHKHSCSRR